MPLRILFDVRLWVAGLALWAGVAFGSKPSDLLELQRLARQFMAEYQANHYDEGERLARQILDLVEGSLSDRQDLVLMAANLVGTVYREQARNAQAKPFLERVLRLREKTLGQDHDDVAASLNDLALVCQDLGQYAEAETYHKRSLAIAEKLHGREHPDVARCLNNLGVLYRDQGRYAEVEPLYRRAIAIREKAFGADSLDVAASLDNLAVLLNGEGRYAEAEPLALRALAVREKSPRAKPIDVAMSLNNLAVIYDNQGRLAESEALARRSLAIKEKALRPDHPDIAGSLNNVGSLCRQQGRSADAEALYERALAIRERNPGPDHPDTAVALIKLAIVDSDLGRSAQAESRLKRALAILEKILGPDHPTVANNLATLAAVCRDEKRYAEAETLYKRALAIREKAFGPNHLDVAYSLFNLAVLAKEQSHDDAAEPLADRALSILERAGADQNLHMKCYNLRADLRWKAKRQQEAVADLSRAIELAEQMRTLSSGAEHQRAEFFGTYACIFEKMVAWQTELGNPAQALDAMERNRARSLLDQMQTQGIDLLAGVPRERAEPLRQAERAALERIAGLDRQMQTAAARTDLPEAQRQRSLEELAAQQRQAQQDYVRAYADIRNESPVFRQAVGKISRPASLAELERWAAEQNAMVLEYLFGAEAGYVLIVAPAAPSRIEEIVVNRAQADVLRINPVPLTFTWFGYLLQDGDGTGLLERLREAADPKATQRIVPGLATLWKVLCPESERKAIVEKKFKRLVIIPDASLAQLPFEALVVHAEPRLEYLLDVGPAIEYAPSATVLLNLAKANVPRRAAAREPVLTVGNPNYAEPSPAATGLLAQVGVSSRFRLAGGRLTPLPYTEGETDSIRGIFNEAGFPAVQLKGSQATKAAVAKLASGRKMVHLACHGMVDQSYGNLFGALAFARGSRDGDLADDGFLTLADIYRLDLQGCELAILSACETNVGPAQRGEGAWALSRGFLAAGSRRVVASNWLVDDEAAASLISSFCGIVADTQKKGATPDYADALQQAKRWIRQQEKWSGPYYWSTFVLVGPN